MFKYFPPERIDVLEKNLICFSNPNNFNDPFEFYANFNQDSFNTQLNSALLNIRLIDELPLNFKNAFKSLPQSEQTRILRTAENLLPNLLADNSNSIKSLFEDSFKFATQEIIKLTRVLCLSERKDNIQMWSHYTDSHKGFVVEFDKDNDFFNQKRTPKDEYGYLRKVKYTTNIPNIDPLSSTADFNYFLTKSSEWGYENEWRILLPAAHADTKIEIEDSIFDLYKYPTDAIRSITLGCKASQKTENGIKALMKLSCYSEIVLYKSTLSQEKYALEFHEV